MFLNEEVFCNVVRFAPLVSIDIIIQKGEEILLGKRKNPPAKEFYFTMGGRIFKNEKIENALNRIGKNELNRTLKESEVEFLGVFEHFYTESICDKNISTHYVNLAYVLEVESFDISTLPFEQHSSYKWWNKKALLQSPQVHHYVKDYFKKGI